MNFIPLPILLVATAFVSLSEMSAQSGNLSKLQDTYQKDLKAAAVPINQQYEKALVRLQKKLIGEDRLKDALLVKREIEALQAGLLGTNAVASAQLPAISDDVAGAESTMSAEPAGSEAKTLVKEWKGDHDILEEGGDPILRLEGREGGTRMMTFPLENLQERFPNGLRIRFKYRSKSIEGDGIEIRGEFPSLRGLFTFRNPTLRFDGEWNEYLWPFSDTKAQEMMNFQVLVKSSEGTIDFKEIEFLPN